MTDHDIQAHWDGVYGRRSSDSVSWYEPHPTHSLELIAAASPDRTSAIIDIGGGASLLVDRLLDQGYTDITVLDVSDQALELVRKRVGHGPARLTLLCQDVTTFQAKRDYALWHDRAVFHFLTTESARNHYVEALKRATIPGSHVVMATFGPEGPVRCSNLDTCRYDAASLANALGDSFLLSQSSLVNHVTPGAANQQFLYALFVRR